MGAPSTVIKSAPVLVPVSPSKTMLPSRPVMLSSENERYSLQSPSPYVCIFRSFSLPLWSSMIRSPPAMLPLVYARPNFQSAVTYSAEDRPAAGAAPS